MECVYELKSITYPISKALNDTLAEVSVAVGRTINTTNKKSKQTKMVHLKCMLFGLGDGY